MKGEMSQYNIISYIYFPVGKSTSGNQVENHSHCPGTGGGGRGGEGILHSSFSVGKGTMCIRASFPLLLL